MLEPHKSPPRKGGGLMPARSLNVLTVGLVELALALAACSIALPQPTPLQPRPSAAPSAASAATQPVSPRSATPAWADLKLGGSLIFITGTASIASATGRVPALARLRLDTGRLQTVFQPAVGAALTAAAVSPDGRRIVMAYSPPPANGVQFGYTGLYLLPADGSASPQALIDATAQHNSDFQPSWSPDGHWIYSAHLDTQPDSSGFFTPTYTVERRPYPNGPGEMIAHNAYWPRLSDDGGRLVYVTYNPIRFTSQLYVAEPDGRNPRSLALPDALLADAPLVSPDGQWIYFSAANLGAPAAYPWLDRLLGVGVVDAAPERHNVPSDWWRVPLKGGQPQRLTQLFDMGLYGAFSPDGRYLAFVTVTGIYVMDLNGDKLTSLLSGTGTYGTLAWVP
jgi:Tol biopolymer transport system component